MRRYYITLYLISLISGFLLLNKFNYRLIEIFYHLLIISLVYGLSFYKFSTDCYFKKEKQDTAYPYF